VCTAPIEYAIRSIWELTKGMITMKAIMVLVGVTALSLSLAACDTGGSLYAPDTEISKDQCLDDAEGEVNVAGCENNEEGVTASTASAPPADPPADEPSEPTDTGGKPNAGPGNKGEVSEGETTGGDVDPGNSGENNNAPNSPPGQAGK
jgi:predicted small lipoprotein YifL